MSSKRLLRSPDRWIGGVCGGIADCTGADVSMIRLVTAVLAILGFGTAVVVYLVAWLIVPDGRDA